MTTDTPLHGPLMFEPLLTRLRDTQVQATYHLDPALTFVPGWMTSDELPDIALKRPSTERVAVDVKFTQKPIKAHVLRPGREAGRLTIETRKDACTLHAGVAALIHVAVTHWPTPPSSAVLNVVAQWPGEVPESRTRMFFRDGQTVVTWERYDPARNRYDRPHVMRLPAKLHSTFSSIVKIIHDTFTREIDALELDTEEQVRDLLTDLTRRPALNLTHTLEHLTLIGHRTPCGFTYHRLYTTPYQETTYVHPAKVRLDTATARTRLLGFRIDTGGPVPTLTAVPSVTDAPDWDVHPDVALMLAFMIPAWEAGYDATVTAQADPGGVSSTHRYDPENDTLLVTVRFDGLQPPGTPRQDPATFVLDRDDRAELMRELQGVNRAYLQVLAGNG